MGIALNNVWSGLAFSAFPLKASVPTTLETSVKVDQTAGTSDIIDRTMREVENNINYDPTTSGAMQRNNKDEVWVAQVRFIHDSTASERDLLLIF
jgi:hypothetical protein